MTIYEPNDDVRPTGAEAAEFDDAPPEAQDRRAPDERERDEGSAIASERQPPG